LAAASTCAHHAPKTMRVPMLGHLGTYRAAIAAGSYNEGCYRRVGGLSRVQFWLLPEPRLLVLYMVGADARCHSEFGLGRVQRKPYMVLTMRTCHQLCTVQSKSSVPSQHRVAPTGRGLLTPTRAREIVGHCERRPSGLRAGYLPDGVRRSRAQESGHGSWCARTADAARHRAAHSRARPLYPRRSTQ